MEDLIEKDPQEAFPPPGVDDVVSFRGTGDPVIDAWERDIAAGNSPDLAGAFETDPEVMKWIKGKKPVVAVEELPEEFHDDFTKGAP